ncbi:uncharacterized protein LOC126898541 isoform X2 [Daktulosphaira vitifoliae]|uniref:uncharacterized protein LOC126898541 isoform X2 n=1 Tax=Daktulosphaira vitifoliae TaxID=58002 RepID=UPI0021AAC97C|nr:uncharacterized protein LOC126898541 isoform X2 [Daktulosphaira vitifoliae]
MAYEDSMFIPPWHIWTADFINNEKWDRYKDMLEFTHPGGHEQLPKEITKLVKEWKRPNELFGTDDLVILPDDDTNDVLKLMTTNKPLMNVKFCSREEELFTTSSKRKLYKWILFHVIMYIHRFQNKSPIPWHPCSIIFSRCKVDGTWNKNPKPEYNPFGKYWLKLFYMGEFRLICVSDHLPISKSGQILLPLCKNKKNLWLPLLIKGLLRVHAVVRNINQFNTITCLTGWTCIRENCWNFQKKDLWLDLMAHNPRPLKNDYKVASKIENHYKQTKITNKISHKECYSMDDSEKKCFHEDDISLYRANPPNSIVTSIFLSPSPVDRIQTSSSTHFNCEQSIPILINSVEMLKNEEVPTWKTIRWTKWAVDNNIKQPHEINEFRKTINFCTPFTALLDQSSSLKILLDKYQNTTDPERREMDFFYLEPFVESIEIYFKKNEAFPFVKSIQFLEFKNNERDQCVYMHIESQYCESILFTFTACQNISLNGGMMIANTENRIENPFVAIETFQWYKVELSTPILYIWSKHSFANIIKIKSGYTLLRIWGDLPEIYSFTIESTVVFTIYNSEEEVFRALTIQPKSLSLFITNVQKAFTQLSVAETHTNNHDQALLQFYLSFMPTIGINEQFLDKANRCKDIRKLVQDAIINWATKNCPKDITIIEILTNFQEMFQERTLGRDQIAQILENERKERDNSQNIIIDVQPSKETKTNDDKSINMGLKKSQYTKNKTTIKSSSPKNSFKTDIIKGIQDNMFDIIYDTLVNMQTNYHPFRDCLQNYGSN